MKGTIMNIRLPGILLFALSALLLFSGCESESDPGIGQDGKPVIVNVDNFVRAETAAQFDRHLKVVGGVNKWLHLRQPTPLDQQSVIRMNRDTLYSSVLVDISKVPLSPCRTPGIATCR